MSTVDPAFPNGVPCPPHRALRAYSFDPSLDTQLQTAVINQVTLKVPWEKLEPGPVGKYLEVVDLDPASGCLYAPVNLDHPALLASSGLAPSEGTPQFHQQMVYGVAMNTIRCFERALGRVALWSPRVWCEDGKWRHARVERLRIYPHALREANAYYSPEKKALLFGYFNASAEDAGNNLPGGIVFTCLSFDIVAHETTHALLDGLHPRFTDATNPDVLAFHEAFADIVALFQHFSFPEVLRDQIARTRGDLRSQNLLGQLAQQFGQAIGSYGALRDALGEVDPETKEWLPRRPDPDEIRRVSEPHARGAILVAAVFDAFLSIYRSRIEDLLRLATGGTGTLAPGEIHPDLVNRLADEASKSAAHVLNMAIRALDYCPPVDITFGEYLRALITADYDLVREDDRRYRIAFIEAFRRRGIYPDDVRTLSEESLRWRPPETQELDARMEEGFEPLLMEWRLDSDRKEVYERAEAGRKALHSKLKEVLDFENAAASEAARSETIHALGLIPGPGRKFQVHSMRPARRIGPDGQSQTELIIEIVQAVKVDRKTLATLPLGEPKPCEEEYVPDAERQDELWFRGGCTLIVDMERGKVRYCITKDTASATRRRRHRDTAAEASGTSLSALYLGPRTNEPFALLHSSDGEGP